MKKLLLLVPIFFLCGCFMTGTKSGSKTQSESTAGEQAADVIREGLNTAPININAGEGSVVSLDIPQNDTKSKVSTKGKQASESEEESSWFSKKRLPVTIALAIGSVSLIVLFYAIKLWRSSSVSANAAFGAADNAVGGAIHMVESWLATSTSDADNSKLLALKAHFEKERGKLNSQ